MFAYKMAVAIKEKGYRRIKIYNGGLKDWQQNKLPVETIAPLPAYVGPSMSGEELLTRLTRAEEKACAGPDGTTLLTLIDFRASPAIRSKLGGDRYRIKTTCPVISRQLDDFIDNQPLIDAIPKKGLVVCISETGNRDAILQRFLFSYGFTNITSLEYGMRGWLKAGYPSEEMMP